MKNLINSKKAIICLITFMTSVIILCCSCVKQEQFPNWNKDTNAINSLTEFVDDVTNENSPNFIPKISRIAVFDFDGTLFCEKFPIYIEWLMFAHRVLDDPDYKDRASAREIEIAKQIRGLNQYSKIPDNLERDEAECGGAAFASMSIQDHYDYVMNFAKTNADGFKNVARRDLYYRPMQDIIKYLDSKGFTIYIVSGTDRFIVKTIASEIFPEISPSNIIGMDYEIQGEQQGNIDGLDYTYKRDEKIVRGPELKIKNVKMNKVVSVMEEIMQYPCLAFGNSTGDESMLNFTLDNKQFKSRAFMVKADDSVREYGSPEIEKKATDLANKNGWITISMRDDWKTIYGDNVEKG